jgi:lipopolysaccharide transport system ATP-binding protein
MRRAEIKKKFDEIVAFSGIDQFIDTPVKHYSSGMYVRLAFAVAAHLEPEILIIDEVLAVGDAEFQKKCLGKMKDVSKQEGRTVLFVSHNMEAVQNLCNEVMLLKEGCIVTTGNPAAVVTQYLHHYITSHKNQRWSPETAPGNQSVKLLRASVQSVQGLNGTFYTNHDLKLEFEFLLLQENKSNVDVTFHLLDERGILVMVGSSAYTYEEHFGKGTIQATAIIPGNLLNQGTYTVNRLLFVENRGHVLYEHRDTLTFEILPQPTGRSGWMGGKEGVIFLPQMQWTLQQVT